MKLLTAAAIAVSGVALLSGCATMSEGQCMVGDWGGQGYRDGAEGYPSSRLHDHAKACAKHGISPNMNAYMAAREDGLRNYCTWENGFRAGRAGGTYHGVCSPGEERAFLPAHRDGRLMYEAEQGMSSAESALNSAIRRVESREDKLDAKRRELHQSGLNDEERRRIRNRIREVEGELQDARRDLRRAEDNLRYAEVELRTVRRALDGRYGVW
ncbi:DUF2799 domain-containing protein [Brevundimonas diminuta]|uniref:DUF2799 domain-containing protein n=1 Tax=Brevundimonas diminuta TaxID=293 RepID=UPI00320B9152